MDIQITHDADRAVSAAGARVLGSRIPCDFRMRLCEFSGPELKVWLCLFLHVHKGKHNSCPGLDLLGEETGLGKNALNGAIRALRYKGWLDSATSWDSKTGEPMASATCLWPNPVPGSIYWQHVESTNRRPN